MFRFTSRPVLSLRSELGFQLGHNGKVVWSDKAKERFKLRIRQITSRNRGCQVRSVIGWINYCLVALLLECRHYVPRHGISHTYKVVLVLDKWLRRRVRLYYWKQWFRGEADKTGRKANRNNSHGRDDAT